METVAPGRGDQGYEEFQAQNQVFATAFSDMRLEIVRSFTDGDTAIIEGVFTARHTGPMPTPAGEIPPTGSIGSFPFTCFLQVRDGRCVSHRVYGGNMAMLAQMGALG